MRRMMSISMMLATVMAVVAMYSQLAGGWTQAAAWQSTARSSAHASATAAKKDIVDTAVAADKFKTLVTAVQAAGLVETLKGQGPFTVFAPTDEAFAKVPKETLEALLKDKQALAEVLTYHVVAGKVKAEDVVKVSTAKTVQGKSVKFGLRVNDAAVTATDIECSNGVIHVIDAVLLPPKGN